MMVVEGVQSLSVKQTNKIMNSKINPPSLWLIKLKYLAVNYISGKMRKLKYLFVASLLVADAMEH